ncbi:8e764e6d-2c8f-4874-bbe9-fe6e22df1859 [Thermothielavioides terrestris]
MGPLF